MEFVGPRSLAEQVKRALNDLGITGATIKAKEVVNG